MKRAVVILLIFVVSIAGIRFYTLARERARYEQLLSEREALWAGERADLEASLARARSRPTLTNPSPNVQAPAENQPALRLTPEEIIVRLAALQQEPSASKRMRQAVYWLEELAQAGAGALPAIREFLSRYQDLDLDVSWFQSKNSSDKLPPDFVLPPSLRFGLFEVVRQMGGVAAESVLAEALNQTGRGVEVAYLTRLLDDLAPAKYRNEVVNVARRLLSSPAPPENGKLGDRRHREHLFAVLSFYGDAGFTSEAQTQLVRADGQIDRSALRYLQQSLGKQAVPLAEHHYFNSGVTNSGAKEPFARLALTYVGADPLAESFWQKAINDPTLERGHRKDLIEDLNQDGFPNTKNLTAADLPLIESRIELIERLAPTAMDQINDAAFKEAYKDLLKMRERVLQVVNTTKP